ncbi:MAG TPA: FAD-dependent oxidoreductase, partial [Armatimonadota bacterium]|nr:FAD-dependent oxidoreductase [Armatimonadota bacterium]
MSSYPSLFSPGKIGQLTIKNRTVMAPMVRNYADENGRVTAKYLAHIDDIARGGVGMMILEASYVTQDGKGFINELGIHNDDTIPGLRELVRVAHDQGAVIGPQLYHGGRQTSSAISGLQPVAPSPIPDPTINEIPHELTIDEIARIVDAFGQAARRAKEAGCDFVEIHGAHGYLITQFLSPFSNARTDAYGGPIDHRMRFLEEVYHAVRNAVGPSFPISVRLSGEEQVPAGLTINDTLQIAQRLQELGVNALHISAGNYASYTRGIMIQPMAIPDGPLIPLSQRIKDAVSIPVIAVGKIRTPELAEDTIRSGKADFIALGRVLLADHSWPRKAEQGQLKEIDKCIACNQGCISRLFDQLDVWCTVNPQTAREEQFAKPRPAQAKKVVVIGGGPAGMEAAKVAAERGHHVTLFEEQDHLGGQLIAAAAAPYRPGWAELREYLMNGMASHQIDVRLNTRVTADIITQEKPDVAIVAIGSSPIRMKIPGIEGANVITARDLLEGHAEAKGIAIVAGGGCSGAQTAEFLADKGHPTTIVEMMGIIAPDSPRAERELLLERLGKRGVKIQMETRIMRVEEDGVVVERPGGFEKMPADTVVICLGSRSNDGLAEVLRSMVPQVMVVGDAVKPRKV